MASLLHEKVAIITGGSSGNGRAIAQAFAEHGAKGVVIADLQDAPREGGEATHELIGAESGCEATFVRCDVTDVADLQAAVDAAGELGGLDVMVNNAGVFGPEDFLEATEADYQKRMDVNVKGTFFGSQLAARALIERGGGSIINISSVAGLLGSGDFPVYCASKGAVRLLTYSLADALGEHGIRVNAIHPGVIETAMTTEDAPIIGGESEEEFRSAVPLGRFGQASEVAGAAVYLASDLSSYVTGESLVVDGGMASTQ
jgi:NAD(P)-dependent dehydrogenase (short-subunit alcohol dehydrogenase family)